MIIRPLNKYIISKKKAENLDELPILTKIAFNSLKEHYGYTGRISEFVSFLRILFEVPEWEFFDERTWNPGEFFSYLMDLQISYQKGEELDMAQLHKDILKVFTFGMKEKRMFIIEHIEEKLWGIFIFLDSPSKDNYII